MKHTQKIVVTSLMMGLVIVCTMFIRIPIPLTTGYVHLGDAMIYLSVLILGWRYASIAAAFGSVLGDLLSGFAMWAPWTFVIKGLMALITGLILLELNKSKKFTPATRNIIAMVPGGILMVIGYFVAEGVMYGSWIAPWIGVPWSIGQFVAGIIIAILLSKAVSKSNIMKD